MGHEDNLSAEARFGERVSEGPAQLIGRLLAARNGA